MNVFVSLPMRNRPDDLIRKEMEDIMVYIRKKYAPVTVYLIDSIITCPMDGHPGAACLGKSIEMMATADLVVFAPGWSETRGCQIEYEVAMEYNIPILFVSVDENGEYHDGHQEAVLEREVNVEETLTDYYEGE